HNESSPMTTKERAALWLARVPPAISGSGGHNQTYTAAVGLTHGFCLSHSDALELETFLANDDLRTGYHLQRWAEEAPDELADPCRRLLQRRLLKATDVSGLDQGQRLELLALAQRLCDAAGLVSERCCGLQQRHSRGYHAYKGGLRLWDGQQLSALEQRSALVQSLCQPQELAWLIHPAEVSGPLRQELSLRLGAAGGAG
ncbi:MAG: hypothetical protein ACO231_07950, partial [Prochlorococcaceae cyanobacterium]